MSAVFNVVVTRVHREDKRVVELLPIWALFESGADKMKALPGREREYTPLNNRLAAHMLRQFGRAFSAESAFTTAFDRLEVLAALSYAVPAIEKAERYWAPPGIYGWSFESRQRIVSELRKELTDAGDKSPFVTSCLIGKTATGSLDNLAAFEEFVGRFHWF